MIPFQRIAGAVAAALLAGCASLTPPAQVETPLPAQWQAPLPHNGAVTELKQWWRQQGDPLLAQWIEAAQAASPTIAAAKAQIEQARATSVAARSAFLPTFDASASATRSSGQPPMIPINTTINRGVQMAWETNVFDFGRSLWNSVHARYDASRAGWHEARVALAAEVANQYYGLRACEKLLEISRADAASRSETARLSDLSAKAGFMAPSVAALARASAAEGNARATQQQAQCDSDIKALVALTAIAEPELRQQLATAAKNADLKNGDLKNANLKDADLNSAEFMGGAGIAIDAVPGKVLAQRPDVYAAELEVAAASNDVGTAQARRWPSIALSGSVGRTNFSTAGSTITSDSWSVGPLTISMPIFDGGRRAADVEAARARYDAAVAQYRATLRQAVREVELALIDLHSARARGADVKQAVEGFRAAFTGTESRYKSGLASLVELEDARRTRLAAEIALVTLQREQRSAWVALYRAAGGGFARADIRADIDGATGATTAAAAIEKSISK